MTERDLYDAALIEVNKLEAPSMLLEDYNYFINKAIQQYINKTYNRYEINQQATDDLRALKVTTSLVLNEYNTGIPNEDGYHFAVLPKNYLHMLNCVVKFNKIGEELSNKCNTTYNLNNAFVARKLTSDIYPSIINNAYFKPSYKTPYYTISLLSENMTLTEKIMDPCNEIVINKDSIIDSIVGSNKPEKDWKGDFVINIRCGKTNKFKPAVIYIDYIKTPKTVRLTEEMLEGEDTTKEMEFPEYVCYEIINEFVKLLLENASDPRLQTNIPINQTIIPPSSN